MIMSKLTVGKLRKALEGSIKQYFENKVKE